MAWLTMFIILTMVTCSGCTSFFEGPGAYTAPMVYVCDAYNDRVTALNYATNEIVGQVYFSSHPLAVAVSPDGNRFFVCNGNNLSIIDARKNVIIENHTFNTSLSGKLAVDRTNGRLYLEDDSDHVYALDLANDQVTDELKVLGAHWSYNLELSPDGKTLYTADPDSSNFMALDLQSGNVKAVDCGRGLGRFVAIRPDGKYAYMSKWSSDEISVIDLSNFTLVDNLKMPQPSSQNVAVNPDGKYAYAACYSGNCIALINMENNQMMGSFATQPYPKFVFTSPDGRYLYLSHIDVQHTGYPVEAIDLKDYSSANVPAIANENGLCIAFNPASKV